jgi:hypothetical protein
MITVDGEPIPTCPRCGRAIDAKDQTEASKVPHAVRPGLDHRGLPFPWCKETP